MNSFVGRIFISINICIMCKLSFERRRRRIREEREKELLRKGNDSIEN